MIGAIWNGQIGLNTFDRAIAIESNNVSNSTTVANKSDQVSFAEMFYDNAGFGNGVSIDSVSKTFTQGELEITNVTTDVAIEGKGFFVVEEPSSGDIFYSRAGSFQKNGDSFLQTLEGMLVKGLSPQDRQVTSTNDATQFTNDYNKFISSINIDSDDNLFNTNIKTTDYTESASDDDIALSGSNYKTASSKIVDVELLTSNLVDKLNLFQSKPNELSTEASTKISQIDFLNATSALVDENDYLTITLDGTTYRQGFTGDINETLNLMSDEISNTQGFSSSVDTATGILTIESLVPGDEFSLTDATVNEQLLLVNNIQDAQSGSGLAMVDAAKAALVNAVQKADAQYLEITNVLATENIDTLTLENINLNLDSLGLYENAFGQLEIDTDGYVYMVEDENKFLVSKLQTAGFTNEQGLIPLGSNIFSASLDSGEPFNADGLNTIRPSFLERSNTDYSSSLSTLLVYQKAFEANSKSVTVSDEFLQTAIEMKK